MPSIPAGFIESTFIFSLAGSTHSMTWTMGWDCADFITKSPVQMAIELRTAFVTGTKPYTAANICAGWTFQGVHVTKQLETGPISGESLVAVVGTAVATPLTPNVAILWNKTTGEGGRRNRGRAFIPPYAPGEASVDSLGVISSGVVTATQTLYDNALATAATDGYDPVLFHQSAPFTPTPITAFTMQPLVATQRRRLRR